MRVGVRKGTQAVVVFLASRIPQGQLDMLAVNLDVGDIVLEDGGDVDLDAASAKTAHTSMDSIADLANGQYGVGGQ